MILFTPNIYVTKYLEATNQLEASFKTKAVNFMKSGLLLDTTKKFDSSEAISIYFFIVLFPMDYSC